MSTCSRVQGLVCADRGTETGGRELVDPADSFVLVLPAWETVEDEVDTYKALALAGSESELSNAATPEHSDFVEKRICVWLSAFCMMSYVRGR